MGTKTSTIGSSYTATPAKSENIGKGYSRMTEDRTALVEALGEEHDLDPASTATTDHGRHLPGSAVIYGGDSEPTDRPWGRSSTSGAEALGVDDAGRIWRKSSTGVVYYAVWDPDEGEAGEIVWEMDKAAFRALDTPPATGLFLPTILAKDYDGCFLATSGTGATNDGPVENRTYYVRWFRSASGRFVQAIDTSTNEEYTCFYSGSAWGAWVKTCRNASTEAFLGTAYKIRTSAVSSPSAGDIWIV